MLAAFCSALRVTFFGIHDAGFDEVFVFAGGDVVAFVAFGFLDGLDDDAAFDTRVLRRASEAELPRRA